MRIIFFFMLMITIAGFTRQEKNRAWKNSLDGHWITIRMEMNGEPMAEQYYENQQLIIRDTTYTYIAESTDKGIVKYTDGKMDIYGRDGVNAGKHFTAIYKLEEGLLFICYNLAGDKYPDSFDTRGKALQFLGVFKKKE